MLNCIFYSIFYALFISLSLGSLRYSQINRTFLSLYKGMLEASVITVGDDGESILPYYNKELVDEYITDYFDKNLKRFAKTYEFSTKYLDENSEDLCISKCRKIEFHLHAKINYFFTYDHNQVFTVESRDEI